MASLCIAAGRTTRDGSSTTVDAVFDVHGAIEIHGTEDAGVLFEGEHFCFSGGAGGGLSREISGEGVFVKLHAILTQPLFLVAGDFVVGVNEGVDVGLGQGVRGVVGAGDVGIVIVEGVMRQMHVVHVFGRDDVDGPGCCSTLLPASIGSVVVGVVGLTEALLTAAATAAVATRARFGGGGIGRIHVATDGS